MELNKFSIKTTTKIIKKIYPEIKELNFYEEYGGFGGITQIVAMSYKYRDETIYLKRVIKEDIIELIKDSIERMNEGLDKWIEGSEIRDTLFIYEVIKSKHYIKTNGKLAKINEEIHDKIRRIREENPGNNKTYKKFLEIELNTNKEYEKATRVG